MQTFSYIYKTHELEEIFSLTGEKFFSNWGENFPKVVICGHGHFGHFYF